MKLAELLKVPSGKLKKHTKIPVKILPALNALYKYIARNMADTVKANNKKGSPTKNRQLNTRAPALRGTGVSA